MTGEDWLGRWAEGRIGWHEADGNAGLKAYWPLAGGHERVLVPLCGKSPDLIWLAQRGHEVVGVELSQIAVRDFFSESGLEYEFDGGDRLDRFTASELPLTLYCGNYFDFGTRPCDALYDRGALVALPPDARPRYVAHTDSLLRPDAVRLIVTLEYDQAIVDGPPFAVLPDELGRYWQGLRRVAEVDDIDSCPPKFRAAGLTDIKEVFWLSAG
jgi:thiopurine S-methyltransferase